MRQIRQIRQNIGKLRGPGCSHPCCGPPSHVTPSFMSCPRNCRLKLSFIRANNLWNKIFLRCIVQDIQVGSKKKYVTFLFKLFRSGDCWLAWQKVSRLSWCVFKHCDRKAFCHLLENYCLKCQIPLRFSGGGRSRNRHIFHGIALLAHFLFWNDGSDSSWKIFKVHENLQQIY